MNAEKNSDADKIVGLTDWLVNLARAVEFIFAIPISVSMTIGIIYIFSWFILGPILLPFAYAVDEGSFVVPFLVVNGAGIVGIMTLFLTDELLDIDRVLFTGVAQMIIGSVVAGAYYFG